MSSALDQIAAQLGVSASVTAGGPDGSDDAPSGLAVFGQLAAQLGRAAGALEASLNNARVLPAMVPLAETDQVASNFALIDLGCPSDGYFWYVRNVIVSDSQDWANSCGTATAQLGVGAQTGPNNPLLPQQLRWAFSLLPNIATFSTNHFVVQAKEHLLCQIRSGTNNQNIMFGAVVEQRPVSQLSAGS